MRIGILSTHTRQMEKVLNGTGTKADPFEVGVVLPESADLVKLDMTYKTTADGHYVVVDGLQPRST